VRLEEEVEVEHRRTWRSFGWEGSLAVAGALAVGAFGLAGSCDSERTSGLHAGSIGGAGGMTPSYCGDGVIASAAQPLAILGEKLGGMGAGLTPELATTGTARSACQPTTRPTWSTTCIRCDSRSAPQARCATALKRHPLK
jgi:hypothetical protein